MEFLLVFVLLTNVKDLRGGVSLRLRRPSTNLSVGRYRYGKECYSGKHGNPFSYSVVIKFITK